jgi:hypothetical protein
MGFDNKVFPITKHEIDENDSFSYFRSYVTFYYYLLIIIKQRYKDKNNVDICENNDKNKKYIKTLFELCYKNDKYFELFYKIFFVDKNILIFTHFNNIPLNFFPYPKTFYYYYPYLTFYGNNNFFTNQEIKFNDKPTFDFVLAHTFKQDNNEVQPTIPIEYLSSCVKEHIITNSDYFLLLRTSNGSYIMSQSIQTTNDTIILNNRYSKKHHKKYKFFDQKLTLSVKDIVYASFSLPIKQEDIHNVFKKDTLKKDTVFYNLRTRGDANLKNVWFAFLYPKLTPFKYTQKTSCTRIQLKKDINVLNLVVDTFYNNEIINEKKQYKYLDTRDINYQKEVEDELFRCINYDDVLERRKHICNFTRKNYSSLWKNHNYGYGKFKYKGEMKSSRGKEALSLIFYKNKYLNEPIEESYDILMDKLKIKFFIYPHGYYFDDKGDHFLGTEFYINNNVLEINDYFKLRDDKEGQCVELYKKGKL